ncbi:hypothetical protein AB0I94_32025 [Streptomyces sp. NPDC050147]|uniref:hypothetical protein n=1 Tax=Streptomyces sp. NPDC050147 TaxID=3155513 RepID=UPI003447C9E0
MDVGGVLARECLPAVAASRGRRPGLTTIAFTAALHVGNDSGVLVCGVSEDT